MLPVGATLAGVFSVAYSTRFIHDVFFNGEPVGLPKTPHEPPRFMRVPVEILALVCLAVGIAPGLTVGPILAAGARAGINISEGTSKSQLARARMILQKKVQAAQRLPMEGTSDWG